MHLDKHIYTMEGYFYVSSDDERKNPSSDCNRSEFKLCWQYNDEDILDAVGMVANEKVQIVNNNNGARLETYIIPGERGTGTICLNGAAARLVQVGDTVIIISYCYVSNEELLYHQPKVAIMDEQNRITTILHQEPEKTVL